MNSVPQAAMNIVNDVKSHCVTSRKVAGSIPDMVIGIFYLHNPSGRTMALGSNQPLINEYQGFL